jgi:hypothetical protein
MSDAAAKPGLPESTGARRVPLWVKLGYASFTALLVPAYWRTYGPENFLWMSDIALFMTIYAVVFERRLPVSMMAVGVGSLEVAWMIDFAAGGKLIGLAAYMYDETLPFFLRALSLFHVAMPLTWAWMLARFGYDRRAPVYQTLLLWLVLPLTYAVTDPQKNINWVFGPSEPQTVLPPPLYLIVMMVVLPLCVHWPMHALLRRLFPGQRLGSGAGRPCAS